MTDCNCKERELEKIAEYYRGCDRDNFIHSNIEFYTCLSCNNIFQRDVNYLGEHGSGMCTLDFSKNQRGGWREVCSDYILYEGRMTKQEIITHPNWAIYYEELAIEERKCELDLEKITETQVNTFKGYVGMLEAQTEFYECNCCSQIFSREKLYLQATGKCDVDEGYVPEVKLTKEEIIENAPKLLGRMSYSDKDKIIKNRKNIENKK